MNSAIERKTTEMELPKLLMRTFRTILRKKKILHQPLETLEETQNQRTA
jgi:hypothetical protein